MAKLGSSICSGDHSAPAQRRPQFRGECDRKLRVQGPPSNHADESEGWSPEGFRKLLHANVAKIAELPSEVDSIGLLSSPKKSRAKNAHRPGPSEVHVRGHVLFQIHRFKVAAIVTFSDGQRPEPPRPRAVICTLWLISQRVTTPAQTPRRKRRVLAAVTMEMGDVSTVFQEEFPEESPLTEKRDSLEQEENGATLHKALPAAARLRRPASGSFRDALAASGADGADEEDDFGDDLVDRTVRTGWPDTSPSPTRGLIGILARTGSRLKLLCPHHFPTESWFEDGPSCPAARCTLCALRPFLHSKHFWTACCTQLRCDKVSENCLFTNASARRQETKTAPVVERGSETVRLRNRRLLTLVRLCKFALCAQARSPPRLEGAQVIQYANMTSLTARLVLLHVVTVVTGVTVVKRKVTT